MTGWSLPSISPEAMRNSKAYPIWPAAPVTATRTGFLLMTISEEKIKTKKLQIFWRQLQDICLIEDMITSLFHDLHDNPACASP
jgi:hypothetical protein